MKLRPEIQSRQSCLVNTRRQIHQYPELGFQENKTRDLISSKLTAWGIEHQIVAKTGIVARIRGYRPGKVLALRVDMDALPIQEENDVPYCSSHSGIMHACGHDGHSSIGVEVAYYFSQHRNFAGEVILIFQPAEEGLGGAKAMIATGILQGVDAIIGLHLWNNLPLGTVGIRSGALMAASEGFDCKIIGKGGHGGMPHQTIDAIVVGSQIVNALQTIVARNIDPLDPCVVTVSKFNAGTKRNIIAGTAELSGTVRYFNTKLGEYLTQRIEQIIAGVCQLHGASYEFNYQRISPPIINHPKMADLVRSVAEAVVEVPENIVINCQTMAGEDFAFYLQQVPGCFFFLGSAKAEKGLTYPHHHPRFDFDETALAFGVEIFVRCVEKFCAEDVAEL